ncbi:MAG TPA: helix-turn-helix transcriptional regulator [Blastocatellia bacterium]|jgi:cytoskeletal protein RodZ|nr:helix-turn-helix transcriptional regulator [Blastocatellia bacterium]
MPTLGEELRRRREERGTTLNDISEATRIGTRFLKAIESDNFSILPGGIFTRSFIRAFAKQVGMSEDEAINLYQQQITGPLAEPQSPTPEQRPRATTAVEPVRQVTTVEPRQRHSDPITFRQTPTRANWPTIIIAGGIALFIVIIVIALVKQLNSSNNESAQQTATAPYPSQPPESPPPAPAVATQPPPSTGGGDAQGAFVVKIEALDGSWVQYKVDDNKPVSKIMKKGQVEEVPSAQNQVKLDYGTSKTLKLTVNNREVTFPPDAIERDGHILISRDSIQPLK